jgi:hypothetical protein
MYEEFSLMKDDVILSSLMRFTSGNNQNKCEFL